MQLICIQHKFNETTHKGMCMDEQHEIYDQLESREEIPEIHHTSMSASQNTPNANQMPATASCETEQCVVKK